MASTLQDYGRHSERYGDIAFYYAFPFRFWVGQNQVTPEDVHTWCRENCAGYYKVSCYTHESSKRVPGSRDYEERIVFVDKVYLSDEADAMMMKIRFDLRDEKVIRPRMKRFKMKRVHVSER